MYSEIKAAVKPARVKVCECTFSAASGLISVPDDPRMYRERLYFVCARSGAEPSEPRKHTTGKYDHAVPSKKLGPSGCAAKIVAKTFWHTSEVIVHYDEEHSHALQKANAKFCRISRQTREFAEALIRVGVELHEVMNQLNECVACHTPSREYIRCLVKLTLRPAEPDITTGKTSYCDRIHPGGCNARLRSHRRWDTSAGLDGLEHVAVAPEILIPFYIRAAVTRKLGMGGLGSKTRNPPNPTR